MELTLRSDRDNDKIEWLKGRIRTRFNAIGYAIISARVRKDGYFYKKDAEKIAERIDSAYYLAWIYFAEQHILDEEKNCLCSYVTALTAKEFTNLTEIMTDPYIKDLVIREAP